MSIKPLEGRFKAKVSDVDLGIVGEKKTLMLSVMLKPTAELVGPDWVNGEFQVVKKSYWLTDTVVTSGPMSGKTSVEVTRIRVKESFGYEGPLALDTIKAAIVGKDVEISCADDGKGFTDVKYVNPPGFRKTGLKRMVAPPEDLLSKMASLWSGEAPTKAPVDANELFKNLVEGHA